MLAAGCLLPVYLSNVIYRTMCTSTIYTIYAGMPVPRYLYILFINRNVLVLKVPPQTVRNGGRERRSNQIFRSSVSRPGRTQSRLSEGEKQKRTWWDQHWI